MKRRGWVWRGLWLAVLLTGVAGCGGPPVADEPDRVPTSEQAEEASRIASSSPRTRWFLHPVAPGLADTAEAVAFDQNQNTVALFSFNPSIDLGSGPLTGSGPENALMLAVAKFRPDGRLLWARVFEAIPSPPGSFASVVGEALAVDRHGDILLVVKSNAPMDFGGGPLERGSFLLKLDSRGRLVWVRVLPTATLGINVHALVVDSREHISLAGSFTGTTDFGSGPLTSKPGSEPDEPEPAAFIAQYTPSGGFLWVWANVRESSAATALTVDSLDHLLAGFDVEGRVALARLSPTSELLWERRPGIQGNLEDIATHGNRVVAIGVFLGEFTFEGQRFSTENLDAFVIAYTRSGEERWARALGYEGTGIAMDQRDGVIITGRFEGGDDLGLGPPQATGGVFVSRLDRIEGEVQWVHTFQGASAFSGYSSDVAVTKDGKRITVVGHFTEPFDFGAGPLIPDYTDPFVIQLGL
jgi:hypothetical protein